jgi:hypothetical protein
MRLNARVRVKVGGDVIVGEFRIPGNLYIAHVRRQSGGEWYIATLH